MCWSRKLGNEPSGNLITVRTKHDLAVFYAIRKSFCSFVEFDMNSSPVDSILGDRHFNIYNTSHGLRQTRGDLGRGRGP